MSRIPPAPFEPFEPLFCANAPLRQQIYATRRIQACPISHS
jgi:hypothetical protein